MNRVFIPLSVAAPTPVAADAVIETLTGLTMGTSWTVKLIAPAGMAMAELHPVIAAGIERQLDEVVEQMSTWREDSDLSRYNSAPAGTWHVLPKQLLTVLDCALMVAQASGGAYDPSVGPVVNLWGFGPRATPSSMPFTPVLPEPDLLQRARTHCGWQRVHIDRKRQAVLQPGGLYLDFSSIAKGFGVDQVAAYLRSMGILSYLVEVGGELIGQGVKADGQPWWVGLEQPPATALPALYEPGIVALHGLALATSGDYRRYFEHAGARYSHTIDPRTAQPVAHQLASVAVLHENCMHADAWATALLVLGEQEGLQLAQAHGLAALFISREQQGAQEVLRETMTPAMQAMLA